MADDTPSKKLDIGQLNSLYQAAEQIDKPLFSEQRSNVLLIAGEHYNKRSSKYFSQNRDTRDNSEFLKLRLVKNHTHRAHRRYVTSILSYGSGVSINPQIEGEIQDQKDAELNQAVWDDADYRYRFSELFRNLCSDFVGIGEVCVLMRWNPSIGAPAGYGQLYDEDGMPVFDENGDPVPDYDQPLTTGEFEFDRIYGFNLKRDPSAQDMRESPYLIIDSLVQTSKLKKRYKSSPDVLKHINEDQSNSSEFIIFDATQGGYTRSKNMTHVRSFYFRPGEEYPEGYFYITTQQGILEEGALPFGIFPIVYGNFDQHPTCPRGRSIVKQARPYQAEINRAASQQALHQITVGDDKVLYQAGTKLAPGALLPGVRGLTYQGTPPTILPGRDGSQFQAYIENTIAEMNSNLDLDEIFAERTDKGATDVYALLFRSASQRQKHFFYTEKFQQFKIDFVSTFLALAKEYYPDDMLVPAIGKKEYINISEFRKTTPQHYRIKILPQDDTLETKFGRQITIQHILQYSGTQLSRADIGKLARHMPFANKEEMFAEFTADYDTARNIILALERGENPPSFPSDNHEYILQALSQRMKQSDYRFLTDTIKMLYNQKYSEHEAMLAEREAKVQAMQSEYIPTEGTLVACDAYEPTTDPTKMPKRVRVPESALKWLLDRIQKQGGSLQMMSANPAMAAGLYDTMNAAGMGAETAMQAPQGMGAETAMPQGVM